MANDGFAEADASSVKTTGIPATSDRRNDVPGAAGRRLQPRLQALHAPNVSGTGLRITLSQTTGTSSLQPAGVLCGFPPFVTLSCPCGRCSGDNTIPCNANADCTGFGTCTNTAGAVQPNQCDDGLCSPSGGGEGECAGNAVLDKYCDGVTRSNGEGFLQCQGNPDCLPSNIGVAAGNCTLRNDASVF